MSNSAPDARQLIEKTFVAGMEHHAVLGSTSDRAKQRAAEQTPTLPWLIVADAQTAGRGRGANRWWTGPGSLALSLLFDPRPLRIDVAGQPLVALATALALVDTAKPLLPNHEVGIHWPNDVMAAGRKLAGILVEVLADGLHVVGIGMNTNNRLEEAPNELRQTATTIFELTGAEHDRNDVLVSLLAKMAEAYSLLAHDPAQIARRADQLCVQRGKTLSIESGGSRIQGRCEGIASDGGLVLETPAGRKTFYTGALC